MSVALIAGSLIVMSLTLPVRAGIDQLRGVIESLGWVGYLAFGAVYVAAVVLALPGSLFTIAAAVMFGLVRGFVLVSVASTIGSALAFLIGRYALRGRVQAYMARHPKAAAVDRAIEQGGWRVVALLRLSPAVPFNLQNYLYGVTGIRFWPCVLTSWVAMMPGTFMWVYLAHTGAVGLSAASGGRTRSTGEWVLLVVGLLATVAATVLITRKAKANLRQHVEKDAMNDEQKSTPVEAGATPHDVQPAARASLFMWAGAGLVFVAVAACSVVNPGLLTGLFGPPAVTLDEAYDANADGSTFDHSAFDALLKQHVDEHGWVDYASLAAEPSALDAYIATLAEAPFDALGRDEKLALLINAYNAFTLRLIVEHFPIDSIRDIPSADRWDAVRWNVGGRVWSLNQIEHEQIRPKFIEPRIHFALVCAAVSCPILRNEAYTGDRLADQLESQAVYVHSHPRWFERDGNTVRVTALYDWYGGDFEQVAGSIGAYIAQFKDEYVITDPIEFLDYDWRLNDVGNRPASP